MKRFDRNDLNGVMEITTVVGCKQACIYCPQQVFIENYHDNNVMDLDQFKRYLHVIPRNVLIDFSGFAEPSQNPNFSKMVHFAFDMGYQIRVNTTATGLTIYDIKSFKKIPFTKFAVHLPDDSGKYTTIPCNEEHQHKIKMIEQSGITNLQFRVIGRAHPVFKAALKSYIREMRLFCRAGNLKLSDLSNFTKKNAAFQPSKHKWKGRIKCSRVTGSELNQNVLLPNGDVLLCCMDYKITSKIGTLASMAYSELFHTREYKAIKIGLTEESDIICRYCEAAKLVSA